MKNPTLTLLFLSLISFSEISAQDSSIDKGIILLRGTSNLNVTFSDGTPIFLGLGGGYFFFNKIPIGVDVSYFGIDGNSTINVEPFARYYFKEEFFAGARLIRYNNNQGDDTFGAGVEGGYVWYLNDFVAVEPTIRVPLIENTSISLNVSFSIYY